MLFQYPMRRRVLFFMVYQLRYQSARSQDQEDTGYAHSSTSIMNNIIIISRDGTPPLGGLIDF